MAVTNESHNPATPNPATPKHSVGEEARRATKAEDDPMSRRSPGAPFAIVALAYLAALAIAGLVIGLVLFYLAR